MVTIIEESKTFYTESQFNQAKKACDLYHAIGTPLVKDLKAVI